MKRIFVFLLMAFLSLVTYAQRLTIKDVHLRPQDARAASHPRNDDKGKKCAIIRVSVVGVDNLIFPDAVGNVEYSMNEYVVYVPHGLKKMRYDNKDGMKGEITFDDYGLEINSLSSYDVVFESESHLRSAIFTIQPANASLVFEGKDVDIDKDGIAIINKPIGEYAYTIRAKGYLEQQGKVVLTEDDISTVTDIVLEELLYPVTINVFPEYAAVFIDNVPYTKEAMSDLKLPEGDHSIRVTATNYQDEERTIRVSPIMSSEFFTLKTAKQEIIKHKEERTRTKVNIRNAFYLTGGIEGHYPQKSYDMTIGGVTGEFSFIHHFGGLLAMREGIGVSILSPDYKDNFEGRDLLQDSIIHMAVDIPIQLGVSFPFGKYNRHLFTILGGGYGRFSFLIKGTNIAKQYREVLSEEHFELKNQYYDFGLRASFKLDISFFTFGADIAQSINGYGFSGLIVLGIKWYKFNAIKRK